MTLPGSTRLRALVALGTVGIVVAAAVSTAASARPDVAQGSKLRIGYVLPDLANPFIAGIRDGAVVEAKKQGVDLLVKGTNDSKGQTDAMLAYVGAKVDAIGVDAIDSAAISPRSRRRTRPASRWSRSRRSRRAARWRRSSPPITSRAAY